MSGTLGSVTEDPLFVTSEQAIKYSCVQVPSEHGRTGYHSLFLVVCRQCYGVPTCLTCMTSLSHASAV